MKGLILFFAFVILNNFNYLSSFTINCKYRENSLDIIHKVYQCDTTNIPLTSGNRVTNITGTHLSLKSNNDVDSIYIQGNWTLNFIPRGFSNFFQNIKAFDIYFTVLTALHGDEFDEFPNLEFLSFWQSNLTTISSRLFENIPHMVLINFGLTSLRHVGHDLFAPLDISKLRRVNFYNNICINYGVRTAYPAAINSLINILRQQCPFYNENLTTTTALTTTTEINLTCSDKNIEDLVCDLKAKISFLENRLFRMATCMLRN
ncbi:hypothetical protein PVAND_004056 [Polypedilum vanderplanki]|uniref:Uncharacterized protein n=1 Tax=Polypedilum vanderplanki TaxID=319348 RepID=A0A9J6BW05_POLVA|nr:hypothetical protein PVAND_004056 [Polypedilum vanderplanki]